MATTLKQIEAIPNHPSDAALWQRIEAYIAHRFLARAVVWTVEGPGEWNPPLIPATVSQIEIWNGAAFEIVTAPDSPLGGFWLSGEGPYRFTASVGGGTMPPAIIEAFTRLKSYLAGIAENTPGARSVSQTIPDVQSETIEREAVWIARAMQQSGAADLLRPYRKA